MQTLKTPKTCEKNAAEIQTQLKNNEKKKMLQVNARFFKSIWSHKTGPAMPPGGPFSGVNLKSLFSLVSLS